jgi:hypothetical protein
MPWAVAVLYLGEPPLGRHDLAIRAGGHVAEGQHAGKRIRRRLEFEAQDVGESAFFGFDSSTRAPDVPISGAAPECGEMADKK